VHSFSSALLYFCISSGIDPFRLFVFFLYAKAVGLDWGPIASLLCEAGKLLSNRPRLPWHPGDGWSITLPVYRNGRPRLLLA
jgi:hypothetical protein